MGRLRRLLTPGRLAILLIVVLIAIDQTIKIAVKTHMALGEAIRVTDWFYIDFVENVGMAYGMTLGSKLFLSLLRVAAVSAIGWYMYREVKRRSGTLYIMLLAMVMAGALGNIVDSMFYGLVFDASTPYDVAQWVPLGEGYASFLMGKVVDMFYFPLIVTTWPDWVPVVGGGDFVFFSPVFNFADACISVAVVAIILFCRKDVERLTRPEKKDGETETNKD